MYTINWKKYGSIREVFIFGYYKDSDKNPINQSPLIYAIWTPNECYKQSVLELNEYIKKLAETDKNDAEIVRETANYRNINLKYAPTGKQKKLLYLGITLKKPKTALDGPLGSRFFDTFHPGSMYSTFFLNIPLKHQNVIIGHIIGEKISDSDYRKVESSLINKYIPILNKTDKKNLKYKDLEIHHNGDHYELFN